MKLFARLLITSSLFLVACSGSYEQRYTDYEEYSQANQRNQGWFPPAITQVTFDLRCVSYLDSLCAFGSYSFTTEMYCDSIMNDPQTIKIPYPEFESKVRLHKEHKPEWFLSIDSIPEGIFQSFKIDRFYVTCDVKNKKAYFILSN